MVGQTLALPTREECEQYWKEYHTPEHIRRHMRQVNRVAVGLAAALQAAGESVNVELVDRASLLHDTVRVTDWDRLTFEYFPEPPAAADIAVWEAQRQRWPVAIPHARVNAEIFADRYPELAQVILRHSLGDSANLATWEEKIVNYADRRVAHDQIVSVADRLEEGWQRYSRTTAQARERDPELVAAIQKIETEIFSRIGGDPAHLPL